MTTDVRAVVAVPVLALVTLLGLAACGGGASGGDAATSKTDSAVATDQEAGATGSRRARDVGNAPGAGQAVVDPIGRDVISTGQISLVAPTVAGPRADVLRLAAAWDGLVTDEQTNSDRRGRILESTLTLRVPTARFSSAMAALAKVAEVQHQSRASKDVTTEVIDNQARVRAAERSIRQIESLLGRAKDLNDIIAIEADLTRRQSDLDSLKSQQAWLDDQTSLSTITVTLVRGPGTGPSADEHGFLVGLEGGWNAFTGGIGVLLTALGAALPFLVLLTLLGLPLRIWLRRRGALSAGSAPARTA